MQDSLKNQLPFEDYMTKQKLFLESAFQIVNLTQTSLIMTQENE